MEKAIQKILDLIKEYPSLFEENKWLELYQKLELKDRPELTKIAMDCGIDPLEYMTDNIPSYYGYKCELPENLTVNGSIDYIGLYSFCSSTNLKRLKIQQGVKRVSDCAFLDCKDLEVVEADGDIENIYGDAFGNCKKLKKVILNGVNYLGWSFAGCSKLEVLKLGTIDSCDPDCFSGCHNIKQASVPGSIVEIIDKSNIELLVMAGIQKMKPGMLKGASKLTFLSLPNIVSVPAFSFKDCSSLQRILYEGYMEDWQKATSESSMWKNGLPSSCVIECKDGTLEIT